MLTYRHFLLLLLYLFANDSKHSVHLLTWYWNTVPHHLCERPRYTVFHVKLFISSHISSWFCDFNFSFSSSFLCHLPISVNGTAFFSPFLFTKLNEIKCLNLFCVCVCSSLPFNSFTFSTRASSMISNNRPERW